jgi:hypothetical protein
MAAIDIVWYDFPRMHKAVRTTPAMSAGMTGNLWSITKLARGG